MLCLTVNAQELPTLETAGGDIQQSLRWSSPGFDGEPRSKGVVLEYRLYGPYAVEADSDLPELSENKTRVNREENISFKVRLPVVNRPRLKVITGVSYQYREFNFDDPTDNNSELYRDLQDEHLCQLQGALTVLHSLDHNVFLLGRASLSYNGNYDGFPDEHRRFAKYTSALLVGRKFNEKTAVGLGVYYNNFRGRSSIYPTLLIRKEFGERFFVEAVVPVNLEFTYVHTPKNVFRFGYELRSASYHVQLPGSILRNYNALELRQSSIVLKGGYEREIHDFLWFGVELGARYGIGLNLTSGNDRNAEILIRNRARPAPYFAASIFLVPPAKWASEANTQ